MTGCLISLFQKSNLSPSRWLLNEHTMCLHSTVRRVRAFEAHCYLHHLVLENPADIFYSWYCLCCCCCLETTRAMHLQYISAGSEKYLSWKYIQIRNNPRPTADGFASFGDNKAKHARQAQAQAGTCIFTTGDRVERGVNYACIFLLAQQIGHFLRGTSRRRAAVCKSGFQVIGCNISLFEVPSIWSLTFRY